MIQFRWPRDISSPHNVIRIPRFRFSSNSCIWNPLPMLLIRALSTLFYSRNSRKPLLITVNHFTESHFFPRSAVYAAIKYQICHRYILPPLDNPCNQNINFEPSKFSISSTRLLLFEKLENRILPAQRRVPFRHKIGPYVRYKTYVATSLEWEPGGLNVQGPFPESLENWERSFRDASREILWTLSL